MLRFVILAAVAWLILLFIIWLFFHGADKLRGGPN